MENPSIFSHDKYKIIYKYSKEGNALHPDPQHVTHDKKDKTSAIDTYH